MRWLALALLVATAAEASRPYPLALPRGCRDRSCVRARSLVTTSSGPSYTLAKSWRWPNTTTGSRFLSASSSGTGWKVVRHCELNARLDAGATTWDCAQADGGFTGTWASNTGLIVGPSFIENHPAFWADVTGGPQLTGATDVDATLNGPYTIIWGGYTKAPAATIGWWFQSLGTGAIAMLYTSGLQEMNDGTASIDSSKTCIGLWCFMSFRSGADGGFYNRVDGTQVNGTGTHTNIVSGFNTFGNRKAQDLGIEGWIQFTDIIQGRVPDNELEVVRQNWYGVGNDAGNTGGSAGGGVYNPVVNSVEFFNQGYASSPNHLYGTSGVLCSKGGINGTNFASTNAMSAALMSDYGGSPVVTANASSGPLSNYKHQGAECDVISCAAGGCGKEGATSDAGAGFYTVAVLSKSGLDGGSSLALGFDSDGIIATPSCTFSGMTPDAGLLSCTSRISNPADGGTAVTFVKPIYVTPDGGSFQLCWYGDYYSPNVEALRLDNTQPGASNLTLAASDIPTVLGGGMVIWYHTPLYDPLTQWFANQGTYYFFDATTAGAHDFTEIRGYTVAGREYDQASSDTALLTDGIGFTPYQLVATSIEWNPIGAGQCSIRVKQNASTVGVPPSTIITTGTGGCPVAPDTVTMCDRFDHSVPSSLELAGMDWFTQN